MIKIEKLSLEIKQQILQLLTKDELLNVYLINQINNNIYDELYVSNDFKNIKEVLLIKNDGNSNFTSFYVQEKTALSKIVNLLQVINKNILLAGKYNEVKEISQQLNLINNLNSHGYYYRDFNDGQEKINYKEYDLTLVEDKTEDQLLLKKYLISFFMVDDQIKAQELTNDIRIQEIIANKIYFLRVNHLPVGMARYVAESNNYYDLSTIYIDKVYQGKGYGKKLIQLMVDQAQKNHKGVVLQVEDENIIAKKLYKTLGFKRITDYTFCFINLGEK